MDHTTQQRTPPMQPSDEATAEHLQLAKAQGDALEGALEAMFGMDQHSRERRAGDYLVACITEEAEGLYHLRNGELEWQEPQDENVHLEVSVRDGADGRLIPGLTIAATLIDDHGKEIGTRLLPFLWHPWLFHYGANWHVPGDGDYTIRLQIAAPTFPRHDKINGKRYAESVAVEFENVAIKTGQK